MKKLPLSNDGFALVDDDIYDQIKQHTWRQSTNGYVRRVGKVQGRCVEIKLHNVVIGHAPKPLVVDHKNGNKLDNQRENLRFVTRPTNAYKPSKSSGVHWHRATSKWEIQFSIQNKILYFGRFEDEAEARSIAALLKGALMYHELTKGG